MRPPLVYKEFNSLDWTLGREPRVLVGIVVFLCISVLLGLAWEIAGSGNEDQYSRPELVYYFLKELMLSGEFLVHLQASMRIVWPLVPAALVGFLVGGIGALFPWAWVSMTTFIGFLNGLSKLALHFLFIFWFGIFLASKLVFVIYAAYLFALTITYFAARGVLREAKEGGPSQDELQLAVQLGMNRWQLFWRVLLPRLRTQLFLSVRLTSYLVWTVLVVLERTGTTVGFGALVAEGNHSADVTKIIAGTLLIAAANEITWGLIGLVEYIVLRLRR